MARKIISNHEEKHVKKELGYICTIKLEIGRTGRQWVPSGSQQMRGVSQAKRGQEILVTGVPGVSEQ